MKTNCPNFFKGRRWLMGFVACMPVLLFFFFSSCSGMTDDAPTSSRTVITGMVKNLDVYPDNSTVSVRVMDFRGSHKQYVDSIAADGSFYIEFDLYTTQDIYFSPIVRTLLARPGDSIHIELDFERIADVVFSGDFASQNTDYHAFVNSYYLVDYYHHADRDLDILDYLQFCDSIYVRMQDKRAEFIARQNPGHEVLQWTSDHLDIKYYMAVLSGLISRNLHQAERLGLPDTHQGLIRDMASLFREDQLHSGVYGLMNTFMVGISSFLPKDTLLHPDVANHMVLEAIESTVDSGMFSQMLAGFVYNSDLSRNRIGFFDQDPAMFDRMIVADMVRQPLLTHYQDVSYHLANPRIRHKQLVGGMKETPAFLLLDSIIQVHRGKVIYLDFWTTWCAPCIALFPKANEMIGVYSDRDIEFVFICMGSSEEQWANHVKQANLDASHIYCTPELTQSLYKEFRIGGHPYYMLVDGDGYIVDSGYHLTPMTPLTLEATDRLLK